MMRTWDGEEACELDAETSVAQWDGVCRRQRAGGLRPGCQRSPGLTRRGGRWQLGSGTWEHGAFRRTFFTLSAEKLLRPRPVASASAVDVKLVARRRLSVGAEGDLSLHRDSSARVLSSPVLLH